MPACIQFYKKGNTQPISLADLDNFICEKLDIRPDPDEFCQDWFDFEGLALAMGKTPEEIKAAWPKRKVMGILESNFDWINWYSFK